MVGRSKILEISRNAPSEEATPAPLEESDTMIAAIKIEDDSHQIEPDEAQSYQPAVTDDWTEELDSSGRPWKAIIVGTILICIFLGWTGFFAWAYQAELLAIPAPARIAELITLWAIPTCLIVLGWLLAMRLSTSEARRFGDVATLLRAESEALEARMRTVNGEIALARSFLAENARELESIGRASSKKLTETAEQLVAALADTDQKAQLLESVSAAAVTNVEMLRNHLPVVTSAAKDTTNQIGNAGNAANEQIRTLTGALKDMLAEMSATSAAMDQLGQQTDETSQKIASAANEAGIALGETTERSEKRADQLLSKLHSGVSDAEHRIGEAAENIDALGETSSQRLNEMVARLNSALQSVSDASEVQDRRIVTLVAQLNRALETSQNKLETIDSDATTRLGVLTGRLGEALGECDQRLEQIDSGAADRFAKLAFAISALSTSSGELTVALSNNEERASSLLGEAERLTQVLDGISRELGDTVPTAFAALQERFSEGNEAVHVLRRESEALEAQSVSLSKRMTELDGLLQSQRTSIEAILQDSDSGLDERRREIDALSISLRDTQARIGEVAAAADEHLAGSLQRVAEAALQATNSSKAIIDTELAEIGERLTEQNRALLAGAIDAQLSGLGQAVNDAILRNLQLSEAATQRVSAQLQSVSELTTNLEQRANAAREQFDGIDDEAFTRRIALLTESLNSAAIDVAKILSNEVTDTAWAAYLKGDRGVFTRRAVRLLDSGEARVIANHYDEDHEFRDHVNRYIHDFEAMMRVLLSTRDGNAIGVTLLSSDVGKLYVALAQAIDRLRN